MQRQAIYALLAVFLCVSVAACKGKKAAQKTPPPPVTEVKKPEPPPPPPEPEPAPEPPKPEPPKAAYTKASLEQAFNTYDSSVLRHFAGPNVNIVVLSDSGYEIDRFTAGDYIKRLRLLKRYNVSVVDYQTNGDGKISFMNVKERGKN